MTDDELMALIAQGDENACRALVQRWESAVFAFLHRMLGSAEDAQELGQETFIRVYRESGRYSGQGQFKAWLFRIAGNLARSTLRRRKIVSWLRFDSEVHDRAHDGDSAERNLERDQTRETVRSAIQRLPERQRQAVLLRQYEELSYDEIALAMDTTSNAVATLLHRAMTTLRKDLSRTRVTE